MDPRVSTAAVEHYDLPALTRAVERHFAALDVWADLHPGMRVTLKPNLLSRNAPEKAVTTHPAVVEAVVRVLQARGVTDILLADSPGGPYSKALLQAIYTASGMAAVAERTGIRLNLGVESRQAFCPEAVVCRGFDLILPVVETDFIINLCKLKTHCMTGLSGGVKNLFGCIPGLLKPELHMRFPDECRFGRMLVDLSLLVKPGVTLADAVVSMEGDGPASGAPRHTGMTFAARSPHALDLALLHFISMPAELAPTVAASMSAGLCPADTAGIQWLGDGRPEPVRDFRLPASKSLSFAARLPGPLRRPAMYLERTVLAPRPAVVGRLCIGCGKCRESCAPGAITIQNRRAVLNYKKCIRCYCCQEMCPVKAVRIRRTGLLRL